MEPVKLGVLGSGQTVFDRPQSHLHASVVPVLKEALAKIKTTEPFLARVVSMGRVVGESTCVQTSNRDQIVYAQRPGRKGPSRFVKNREPIQCKGVVVVLKRVQGGNYLLITAFIGDHDHKEPWDERATQEDAQFWVNHALIWGSEEIIAGTEGSRLELWSYRQQFNYQKVDPAIGEIFREYYRLMGIETGPNVPSVPKLAVPVVAELVEGRLESRCSYRIDTVNEVEWQERGWRTLLSFKKQRVFVLIDQYGHEVYRSLPVTDMDSKYWFLKDQYDYPEWEILAKRLRPCRDALRIHGRRKVKPGHAVEYQELYRKFRNLGLPRGVAKRKALAEREATNSRCFDWRVYRASLEELDEFQARLDAIEQKVQENSAQLRKDREMIREKLEELRRDYPELEEVNLEEN